MGLLDWLKRLGSKPDEDAAEREELGLREDVGEAELEQIDRAGGGAGRGLPGLAGGDAAEVAEADLSEFEPPRDPAP